MTKDRAVAEIRIGCAKVMEPPSGASGLGAVQVRRIGVYTEDHVRRSEDEGVGGVGFGIAEKAHSRFEGGLGGIRLVGGEEAHGSEHGGIDGTSVVQYRTNNSLNNTGIGGGKGGGVINWRGLGGRAAISRGDINARGLTGLDIGHVEADKQVRDVGWVR